MKQESTIKTRYVVYIIITIGILASINYAIAQTGKPNPGHSINEISGLVIPPSGDTFIHYGSQVCPSSTEELYDGFLFASRHSQHGGSEPICIQRGDSGVTGATNNDRLYTVGTGPESYGIPPGIPERKKIKCSVCYAPRPVAEIWGSSSCPSGWTAAYTGYTMANHFGNSGQVGRQCVDNVNFDSSINHNINYGSNWYGSTIYDITELSVSTYDLNTFVKCAVCIKNV